MTTNALTEACTPGSASLRKYGTSERDMAPVAERVRNGGLLTVHEAADFLGVAPNTVRKMISDGKLRAFSWGKRFNRVAGHSIRDFCDSIGTKAA